MTATHYETLGVDTHEDRKAIDRAYRKLARQLHPDVNDAPDAQERLASINDAYAVLSNTKRRDEYDKQVGVVRAPTEAAAGTDQTKVTVVGDPTADRGPDIVVEATLTPAELGAGAHRNVDVPYQRSCAGCRGTGYDPAGSLLSCATCSGLGMDAVTGVQCVQCRGRGAISQSLCRDCGGEKSNVETYRVPVLVPAGARPGAELVHAGGGLPGRTSRGDLRVRVTVDLPDHFIQSGGGVGLEVPVHLAELILGATVTIPTVTGQANLTIEPGTADGAIILVPDGGFPNGAGDAGPLHARVRLVPPPVTDKTRAALRSLLHAERESHDLRGKWTTAAD